MEIITQYHCLLTNPHEVGEETHIYSETWQCRRSFMYSFLGVTLNFGECAKSNSCKTHSKLSLAFN